MGVLKIVYVGKKGQKYEVQYCIVLREGKDAGIKHYIWTDKKTIERFFENFRFGEGVPSVVDMGHIIGQKKGEATDKIYFRKGCFNSLVFDCKNQETTNKCFEYWKLPFNFPNLG